MLDTSFAKTTKSDENAEKKEWRNIMSKIKNKSGQAPGKEPEWYPSQQTQDVN